MSDSVALFNQLRDFSREAIAALGINLPYPSPNHYSDFNDIKGVIFHYSASPEHRAKNTLQYFLSRGNPSVNIFVLDHKIPELASIESKYSMLDYLDATCIMVVPPDMPAWHAGWVNRFCLGIEFRNSGYLKKSGGQYHWWADNWRAPFGGKVVKINGRYWEPYTFEQVVTGYKLLQYINDYTEGSIQPEWVLPHSAVSTMKYDAGPAFPIHEVRSFGLSDKADSDFIDSISKFNEYSENEEIDDEVDDESFIEQLEERQLERLDNEEDTYDYDNPFELDFDWVDDFLEEDLTAHNEKAESYGENVDTIIEVKNSLYDMGYFIEDFYLDERDNNYITNVKTFQRSTRKLEVDGIVGKKTKKELKIRLKDLKLWK